MYFKVLGHVQQFITRHMFTCNTKYDKYNEQNKKGQTIKITTNIKPKDN